MIASLRIGPRLALAALLFLIPIGYQLWVLSTEKATGIEFASTEVAGALYLTKLAPIQGRLAAAALQDRPPSGVAAMVETAQAHSVMPGTSTLASAARNAAREAELRQTEARPTTLAEARTKLRALIAGVGDQSNLILDNVLDTYYLTDAVLNRLPDALDRLADAARLAGQGAAKSTDPVIYAQFLIQIGGLETTLDALKSALDSARANNADGVIARDVMVSFVALQADLGKTLEILRTQPDEAVAATSRLVERIVGFNVSAATTLQALLQNRVTALERGRLLAWLIAVGLSAAAMATLLLIAFRGISRPLRRLESGLLAMAHGDLDDVQLPPAGPDEVGQIALAGQTFLEKLRVARAAAAEAAAQHARRDRRQAAMDTATQDFGASISGVLTTLAGSAEEMRRAATEMAAVADRTQGSATTTAGRAENSVADLGAVSAATEQLTASAGEIARQVAQATETSREAGEHARTTDARMGELQEAAERIGDVVRLISEIAGQTNLLALNATIEAARAGDAGKGFAVVASEVKQLAAQTARATEDIAAQVSGIRNVTEQTATAVRRMGATITQVDEVAAAIAAAVEQQSAATREIAGSVLGVADTTRAITDAMRDVADAATQSGNTGQNVQNAAAEVNRVAAALSGEVDNFLLAMRADDSERRRYERIPGRGLPVVLRPGTSSGVAMTLADVSRGGCALAGSGDGLRAGMEVTVDIASLGLSLAARVARLTDAGPAMAFSQDTATQADADRLLAYVRDQRAAA